MRFTHATGGRDWGTGLTLIQSLLLGTNRLHPPQYFCVTRNLYIYRRVTLPTPTTYLRSPSDLHSQTVCLYLHSFVSLTLLSFSVLRCTYPPLPSSPHRPRTFRRPRPESLAFPFPLRSGCSKTPSLFPSHRGTRSTWVVSVFERSYGFRRVSPHPP